MNAYMSIDAGLFGLKKKGDTCLHGVNEYY